MNSKHLTKHILLKYGVKTSKGWELMENTPRHVRYVWKGLKERGERPLGYKNYQRRLL